MRVARNLLLCLLPLLIYVVGAQTGTESKPPVAPVRPVTDIYFGTAVTDPYRWMEAGGPELLEYMHAQDAVTRARLQPFANGNEEFYKRLLALSTAVPIVSAPRCILDQYFYTETPPDKSDAELMTRPVEGGSGRLLLDPTQFAQSGKHAAISYYVPSWDGKFVAVGVSLGGSEDASIHILETATGKSVPELIPALSGRARHGPMTIAASTTHKFGNCRRTRQLRPSMTMFEFTITC